MNDSTKFTLTVYDKDKNKKRDLYTWNNDTLHLTYGTARGNSITENESSFEDVSGLTGASYVDFTVSGQSVELPAGVNKVKIQICSPLDSPTYKDGGSLVKLPDGTNTITYRHLNYAEVLDSNISTEIFVGHTDNGVYKIRMWYGKLINEL